MRRFLVSLGLAAIVGGTVLGAAASLPISSSPLSAGVTQVPSCDTDGVDLLWNDTHWTGTVFAVGTVEAQHLAGLCAGRPWTMVLLHDGVELGRVSGGGPAGGWYQSDPPDPNNWFFLADFSAQGIDAAAVNGVALSIYRN
jgi:hypothetical protein